MPTSFVSNQKYRDFNRNVSRILFDLKTGVFVALNSLNLFVTKSYSINP